MLNNLKYLIGIILAICFIAWVKPAKASDLDDLLKNKVVEYTGVCRIDKHNLLTFQDSEDMKVVRCVVGAEPPDTDTKFILLFDEKGPVVLLQFSMATKAQGKLWVRGSI